MKKSFLFLSLVANAALAAVFLIKRSHELPSNVAPPTLSSAVVTAPALTAAEAAAMGLSVAEAAALRNIWAGLSSGDLSALVARLRAEGYPPKLVRSIIIALVRERFRPRWQAESDRFANTPYWKNPNYFDPAVQAANREITQDYVKTIRDLIGKEDQDLAAQQFSYLGPEKMSKLQNILHDYNDLSREVYTAAMAGSKNGQLILLPEDREKLAYLEKQKQADVAKALTPDELEEYQLRSSNTANMLRNQLAGFNPTEAEFRTIFKLQQAFNDQQNPGGQPGPENGELVQQRQAAQKQLQAEIEATLPPDRAAEYKLATDPRYAIVSRLVARLELPSTVTSEVVTVQQDIQQRATTVRADQTLSADERSAQLGALSQEATQKITTALGGQRGFDAYKQYGGQWLQNLQPRRRVAPKG